MRERRIYKYELQVVGTQKIMLPERMEFLCFQCQRNIPCIWAVVDPKAKKVEYTFRLYGTDHPIEEEKQRLQYLGTAQMHSGRYIWHLFEEV